MAGSHITVIIRQEGEADVERKLEQGVFDLGRSEDCELYLEDISVSRHHARLHVSEDRIFIEDLDSGNGLWFNGRRVRTQTLVDGDEIVIDPFTIKVEFEELSETGQVTAELTAVGEEATQLLEEVPEISLSDPITTALARLEVVAGEGLPPAIDLDRNVTLGRSDQRDIVLAEPAASRQHAEINLVDGSWFIKDSGSANGLYVNGQLSKEKLLEEGDIIRIGATEFRFVHLGEPSDTGTLMMTPGDLQQAADAPSELQGSGGGTEMMMPEDLQEAADSPSDLRGSGDGTEDYLVKEDPGLCHMDSLGVRGVKQPGEDFTGTNTSDYHKHTQPPPALDASLSGQGLPQVPGPSPFGGPAPAVAPPALSPPVPGQQPVAPPALSPPVPGQQPAAPPPLSPPVPGQQPAAPSPLSPPVSGPPQPMLPELSPNLGPAPDLNSAFSGMEMQLDTKGSGKKLKMRKSGEGIFGNWVRTTVILLLGFVALVAVSQFIGKMGGDEGSMSGMRRRAPVIPTTAVTAQADKYIQKGVGLFKKGQYFEAFGKFNQAVQLAPDNENALRLQYTACEFVSIEKLFVAVQMRAVSDSERQEAKVESLRVGSEAMAGKGSVSKALSLVRRALELNQGDPELSGLEAQLSKKAGAIRIGIAKRTREQLRQDMQAFIQQGEQERARGNYDESISKCNDAQRLDPDRSQTDLIYRADDCLTLSKGARRKSAQVFYTKGVQYMESSRLMEARAAFDEALRKDRDYVGARRKRADVQARLETTATEVYNKAVVMQKSNNLEKAIVLYQQTMDLVGDPKITLYRTAEKKLRALTGG